MLSSSVTSTKLSNRARREPATITWQLTKSERKRTYNKTPLLEICSLNPQFLVQFSWPTNTKKIFDDMDKNLNEFKQMYLSPIQ